MRALVRFDPEPYSLRLEDLPEPEARPGWVVVAVAACGICGSDVHARAARLSPSKSYPWAIGHEFAGTVVEVGDRADGWSIGDAVACEPYVNWCGTCRMCRLGRPNNCPQRRDMGFGPQGGCATYAAVPVQGLHRVPACVDVADAALTEPTAVAYNALFQESRVCPGDLVVVLGCGPIGLLCAALALAAGAEVVLSGWTGDGVRLAAARAIGVHHVVDAAADDLPALVRGLAGAAGPDLIVDAVGSGATFQQAIGMAGACGQVTKVGWFGEPQPFQMNAIVARNIRIHGVYATIWDVWDKSLRVLAAGKIAIDQIATKRLPLDRWEEGFQAMIDRTAVKVLLLPG